MASISPSLLPLQESDQGNENVFNVTSMRGHSSAPSRLAISFSSETRGEGDNNTDTQVLAGRIRPFFVSGLHYLARWSPDSIVALFYAQVKSEPSTLRD